MAHHRSSNQAIFSMRTIITMAIMMLGIVVMVFTCLITISVPCVTNFYNQMPVYPDAELIEKTSSTANWIAAGELNFVYRTSDDRDTVRAWYRNAVDDAIYEAEVARVRGERVPKTWQDHIYFIESTDEGTIILLDANCLN